MAVNATSLVGEAIMLNSIIEFDVAFWSGLAHLATAAAILVSVYRGLRGDNIYNDESKIAKYLNKLGNLNWKMFGTNAAKLFQSFFNNILGKPEVWEMNDPVLWNLRNVAMFLLLFILLSYIHFSKIIIHIYEYSIYMHGSVFLAIQLPYLVSINYLSRLRIRGFRIIELKKNVRSVNAFDFFKLCMLAFFIFLFGTTFALFFYKPSSGNSIYKALAFSLPLFAWGVLLIVSIFAFNTTRLSINKLISAETIRQKWIIFLKTFIISIIVFIISYLVSYLFYFCLLAANKTMIFNNPGITGHFASYYRSMLFLVPLLASLFFSLFIFLEIVGILLLKPILKTISWFLHIIIKYRWYHFVIAAVILVALNKLMQR